MRRCILLSRKSAPKTAALILTVLLCGSATSYGASVKIQEGYRAWYEQTTREMQEICSDGYIEYLETGTDSAAVTEELGETGSLDRSTKTISWTVGAGVRKRTAAFAVESGQKIRVAVIISPSSSAVKVGIVKPNGDRVYVTGSGTISHTFSGLSAGNYRVYIQNDNSTSVTASGAYSVEE